MSGLAFGRPLFIFSPMKNPRALQLQLLGACSIVLSSTSLSANTLLDPESIQKISMPNSRLTSLLNFLFSPALTTRDTSNTVMTDSLKIQEQVLPLDGTL